jgi:hypothetical protein
VIVASNRIIPTSFTGPMRLDVARLMNRAGGRTEQRPGRSPCTMKRSNGVLRVDCRNCPQGQSLEDPVCLKAVVRALASDQGIREVLLSRDWEVAYDRQCVEALSRLADVLKFCSVLSFHLPFEECAACSSNPKAVMGRVMEALPRAAPELDTEVLRLSVSHGRACEQCSSALKSNLDHVSVLLSEAERYINRVAYKVVLSGDQ